MKKIIVTGILLISANLVLANAFMTKCSKPEVVSSVSATPDDLAAQQEFIVALNTANF